MSTDIKTERHILNLFEYQNKEQFQGKNLDELENFLDDIWKKRERYNKEDSFDDSTQSEVQRFIQIFHKQRELKSNKYTGVIQFGDLRINLLPKIFYENDAFPDEWKINAIQNHILWYLSFCRKIKFPNYQTSLGSQKSDFFEVLIYLFAKYTRQLLNSSVFQEYTRIDNELNNVKGRINTPVYINENISTGRWHKINCTYDSFEIDNTFNRVIKYVARLLVNTTKHDDNRRYLNEILFLLDEVSDVQMSVEDCKHIQFNPMYDDFATVRDYCILFLSNAVSFTYKNNLKLFAFLLPMEYLFEDFIYGFMAKELNGYTIDAQTMGNTLDTGKVFTLSPDLLLKTPDKRRVIADTKYKLIDNDSSDPKKGVSQSDLYQMVSYAIRLNIQEIFLLYPQKIGIKKDPEIITHIIKDELAEKKQIVIKICQLPVINTELFTSNPTAGRSSDLQTMFKSSKENLSNFLKVLFSKTTPDEV